MKIRKVSKVYTALANWRKFQFRLFGEGIIVGACAGLVIVAFRYALELAESLRTAVYSQWLAGNWPMIPFWFFLLLCLAFILHRIVVMEHGKVAETGTHGDLLAANGIYRRLYELQILER